MFSGGKYGDHDERVQADPWVVSCDRPGSAGQVAPLSDSSPDLLDSLVLTPKSCLGG